MSEATARAEILELQEKLLKLAHYQVDIALKQADREFKQSQTKYLPWQVWTAGVTAGAAAAVALVAIGHWL